MLIEDLLKSEHSMLRQELQHLKNCQIQFLTFPVPVTALLLSFAINISTNLSASSVAPPLGAFYLIPLTILLPFWFAFFDKATTITRIVGYFRLIEDYLLDQNTHAVFIGWENALALFRDRQEAGSLPTPLSQKTDWFKLLFLQTTHRYWMLTYYTFFGLSFLCIAICFLTIPVSFPEAFLLFAVAISGFILGWLRGLIVRIAFIFCFILWVAVGVYLIALSFNSASIVILAIATILFSICASRNGQMIAQLAWGYYSYKANWYRWNSLLRGTVETAQISTVATHGLVRNNHDAPETQKGLNHQRG